MPSEDKDKRERGKQERTSVRLQCNGTDSRVCGLGERRGKGGGGRERKAGSAEKEAQSGCVQYP